MAKTPTDAEPDEGADGDIIDQLNGMSDARLLEKFGLKSRLEEAKADLKEAAGLKGKARELVVEKIEKLMAPDLHPHDVKYAVSDAKRQAAPKKTTPNSMLTETGAYD